MLKDREVVEDKDGTLYFMDPAGVPLAFRKTQRKKLKNPGRTDINAPQAASRVDERAIYYQKAKPLTVGHIVFNVPDLKAQQSFYVKRLGFVITDHYVGRGVFLRVAPSANHHSVFFLEDEAGKTSINHIGFGVRDIHELLAGGMVFTGQGWKTAVGPGRHIVSSCYFWYFNNPAGGNSEYFCDGIIAPDWKVGRYNPAPTFAEWAQKMDKNSLAFPNPNKTRREMRVNFFIRTALFARHRHCAWQGIVLVLMLMSRQSRLNRAVGSLYRLEKQHQLAEQFVMQSKNPRGLTYGRLSSQAKYQLMQLARGLSLQKSN